MIAAKVANALALDYPRERLELIVASDGSADATVERARAAGADLVLDLPRGGKVAAQNAAAERASGEILAFSDANSVWAPDALRHLVEPFADPAVGYACGQVRFLDADGDNLEGAYWRYEMAVREMESALAGVTAGNGAIYAVRAGAYIPLPPSGSHDLSFPFPLAKRGMRSLYVPWAARRGEDGADAGGRVRPQTADDGRPLGHRRRRGDALARAATRRSTPSSSLSHRLLRYLTPFLHLVAFAANLALLGQGWVYVVDLGVQLAAARRRAARRPLPLAPLRIARYYVMTTASIAAGLWDRVRHGAPGDLGEGRGTR